MDITDDFDKGDQFNIYDNGVLIGTTPAVPVVGGSEVGPAAAFIDPTYSHGSFNLGAGSHSITIEATGASYSGGRGYIRVMNVESVNVGGIAVIPINGSGSTSTPYVMIIGGIMAAFAALGLSGWFARRRWLGRSS